MLSPELEQEMARIQHGDHPCLIYESTSEQMAAITALLSRGLARGDRCVYVIDDRTAEEVSQALKAGGLDVELEVARGALLILTKHEVYLRSGRFGPEAVAGLLRQFVQDALRAGFSGTTATVEMTWPLESEPGGDGLIEYEALLNKEIPDGRAVVVCQYNLHRFPPEILRDVLRTHPVAILGDLVCPNLYYEPPPMVLGPSHQANRAAWMVAQLKRARAVERSLEEMNSMLEQRVAERTAALERELERSREIGEIMRTAMEGTSSVVGEDFFRSLVYHLASVFRAPYALAGELAKSGSAVQTIAVWANGSFAENFQYDLRGTPCENVLFRQACYYPRDVQKQFPEDRLLAEMAVESYRGLPLRDSEGKTLGIIIVMDTRPMLPISNAESILQIFAARGAAELERRRMEAEREEYIHTVSHDLRTPLAVIQGHAQLVTRTLGTAEVDARVKRSVEAIAISSRRMSVMIRDLVDAARMESSQLRLNREPLDLRAFLLEMKDRLSESMEVDRLRVEAPEVLPRVLADADRLERILLNLLTNALKYSLPATEVRILLARRDDEVVTSIVDRGAGIPPEELPQLFQRYHRTRLAQEQKEGLGLGLYITRGLVEAHGGRIWAESQLGQGSAFHFSLPIAGPSRNHPEQISTLGERPQTPREGPPGPAPGDPSPDSA